jgi:glycosyltransferase involved in cell wall biosynthesis
MKITYIAPSKIPSTTANSIQVMKVCQALTQLGHETHLFVPGNQSQPWSEMEEQYGVHTPFQIAWLPAHHITRKLDFAWAAVRQAKRNHSDVVYTRLLWAAIFALRHKLPVILEMHEVPSGRFAPRLYRHYLSLPGKRLTVFITRALQIEIEKSLSVRHLPAEALIAPDGVDLERFDGLPAAPAAREALGFPEATTAVYSGGFYPGRGLEILFDLAVAFPQQRFLWIGGQLTVMKEWHTKVKAGGLTNVTLTGFIPNQKLPLYLACADVLLMPYCLQVAGSSGGDIASVTSPMKLFEYMACGRAILCSDLPVLHEILNTANALFYPPDDLPAMKIAFSRLLQEPQLCSSLGHQARQDVIKFSWKVRMQTILEHFSAQFME